MDQPNGDGALLDRFEIEAHAVGKNRLPPPTTLVVMNRWCSSTRPAATA
nr:hypothetical protein [Streptomyces californicus]